MTGDVGQFLHKMTPQQAIWYAVFLEHVVHQFLLIACTFLDVKMPTTLVATNSQFSIATCLAFGLKKFEEGQYDHGLTLLTFLSLLLSLYWLSNDRIAGTPPAYGGQLLFCLPTTNMQSPPSSTTIFLPPTQKAWILQLVPHYQWLYRAWYWVMLAETLQKNLNLCQQHLTMKPHHVLQCM